MRPHTLIAPASDHTAAHHLQQTSGGQPPAAWGTGWGGGGGEVLVMLPPPNRPTSSYLLTGLLAPRGKYHTNTQHSPAPHHPLHALSPALRSGTFRPALCSGITASIKPSLSCTHPLSSPLPPTTPPQSCTHPKPHACTPPQPPCVPSVMHPPKTPRVPPPQPHSHAPLRPMRALHPSPATSGIKVPLSGPQPST